MKLLKPDGNTIFCDDIRQEVGNKLSLMGVYSGDLIVEGTFPMEIPRLGFHISLREDSRAPAEPITFLIYLPQDPEERPSHRLDVLPREAEENRKEGLTHHRYDVRNSTLVAMLSRLAITQEGLIRVRARIADEVIKLGTIRVRSAAQT